MKRAMLAGILAVFLTAGYGYAMMGGHGGHGEGGMMGGGMMMGGRGDHGRGGSSDGHGSHGNAGGTAAGNHGGAGQHEGHTSGNGELKSWDNGMSKHMLPMMQSLNGITQRLSTMMEKEMTPEAMKMMSEIMENVSAQMAGMSEMMFKQFASDQEMHELHMKINDTEKKLPK